MNSEKYIFIIAQPKRTGCSVAKRAVRALNISKQRIVQTCGITVREDDDMKEITNYTAQIRPNLHQPPPLYNSDGH